MSKPKISVIMLSYNHQNFIEEAVSSILEQTFSDFELIIIDDGSIDDTYSKLEKFSDKRIVKIKQDYSGPSVAINNGLARCNGEYIALMSGNETSISSRLETQMKQLETYDLDLVFCPPSLMGAKSEKLSDSFCPRFYYGSFENTETLYRELFFKGNFLLATSMFARRDAMLEIGNFHPGLIQTQDFDYWIRACKKRKKIQLFEQRLVNYRHLSGPKYPENNINWARVESKKIYEGFFKNSPNDFLIKTFGDNFADIDIADELDLEIALSFLYLQHNDRPVKEIGFERLLDQLGSLNYSEKLIHKYQFSPSTLFRIHDEVHKKAPSFPSKVFKIMINLFKYAQSISSLGLRMSEEKMQKQINNYLSKGDFSRASNLIKTKNIFVDGVSWGIIFSRVICKLGSSVMGKQANNNLTKGDLIRASNSTKTKSNNINNNSWRMFFPRVTRKFHRSLSVIQKKLRTLYKLYKKIMPKSSMLLELHKLYDYSLENNLLFFDESPERISITLPQIFGKYSTELEEGSALCPHAYITIVPNSFITGGSGLVLTNNNKILSDELVEFSGKEYGIKSPNCLYKDQNKIFFEYDSMSYLSIPEGIMLLTEHDTNYFHWIVEVLPKLLFINTFPEFNNLPLIITADLHENLEDLLGRLNTTNRRIIRLQKEKLYKVLKLIIPSPLSRINDRYEGKTIHDQDIILSHNWISKVSNSLRRVPDTKPWRKIYIKRNPNGYRIIKNSEEIEQYLIEQGFEVISLDTASIDYQLELFSQTSVIVSATGAALTNILFCQPGTKVIVFMVEHESSNYYFWNMLGKIADTNVELIIGKRTHRQPDKYAIHDDFYLPLELLKQRIEKFTNG